MAHEWAELGERGREQEQPIWGIPEHELHLLPASMRGMSAVELGCGTGYVSACLARRGATVVGIDNSEEQLRTACRRARAHRSWFDLHIQDWRTVEVDPGGVEFNLAPSTWFRLFHETGFDVVDFQEIRAPDSCNDDRYSIPAAWAKRWPSEQVWQVRKRSCGHENDVHSQTRKDYEEFA